MSNRIVFSLDDLNRSMYDIDDLDGKIVRLCVTKNDGCRMLFAVEEVNDGNEIYVLSVDKK